MRILEIKNKYQNRKFIIKKGDFEPVDTTGSNIIYTGSLDADKYDGCTVSRYYVLDHLEEKTVIIYIPNTNEITA